MNVLKRILMVLFLALAANNVAHAGENGEEEKRQDQQKPAYSLLGSIDVQVFSEKILKEEKSKRLENKSEQIEQDEQKRYHELERLQMLMMIYGQR